MAKYDEALLKEFYMLDREVKAKTRRLEEIKELLREKGSFATKHFVCVVSEHLRVGLVPLDQVRAALGAAALETHGLIKTTTYTTVKVAPKMVDLEMSSR